MYLDLQAVCYQQDIEMDLDDDPPRGFGVGRGAQHARGVEGGGVLGQLAGASAEHLSLPLHHAGVAHRIWQLTRLARKLGKHAPCGQGRVKDAVAAVVSRAEVSL